MERPKRGAELSPLIELSKAILNSIQEETKPRPPTARPSPRPLREVRR